MKFEEYYRRYGIKTGSRFKDPVFITTNNFVLPHQSVLVYLPTDDLDIGPSPAWNLINNTDRDLVLNSFHKQPYMEGARKINFEHEKETKKFLARFRRFTRLRNLDTALRNKNTILIENTATLRRGLAYSATRLRNFNEQTNFIKNAMANIKSDLDQVKEHVFFIPMPTTSTSFTRAEYGYISPKPNDNFLKRFAKPEDLFHAHLVMLLTHAEAWMESEADVPAIDDDNYRFSAFNVFSKKDSERVVFLFQVEDKVTIISLKKLIELTAKDGMIALLSFFESVIEQRTLVMIEEESEGEVQLDDDGKLIIVKDEQNVVLKKDKPTAPLKDKVPAISSKDIDSNLPLDIDVTSKEQRLLVKNVANEAKRGNLSSREQQMLLKEIEKSNKITYPGTKQTLGEYANITPTDLAYEKPQKRESHKLAVDDSYQENTNLESMKQYNTKLLDKDIVRNIMSMQRSGMIVTEFEKETIVEATGARDFYTISVLPIRGKPSKIRFDIPKVKPNGRFTINNTEVFYVPQRSDIPIRKIKPDTVKITSYYGQNFITRGRLKANDESSWFIDQIESKVEDKTFKIKHRNVADYTHPYPILYTLMAEKYESLSYKDYTFKLDASKRNELVSGELEHFERHGGVVIGTKGKLPLVLEQDSTITLYEGKNEKSLGRLENLLGLDIKSRNLDAVEIRIFGKHIPLGMLLGQRVGLSALISLLGIPSRSFITGERGNEITEDEFALKFNDKTLVFPTQPKKAAMILNSLNIYRKHLANYNVADMDNPDAYFSILESAGLGLRYFIEIDTFFDLFIDPTCEDELRDMGEPTNMTDLLVRAAELLSSHDSPKEVNPQYMRIRNYERFGGFVYKALVDAERVRRSRPAGSRAPISVDPKLVMRNIQKDAAKNMVEVSNPVRNVREKGFVTYSGEGGRTAQTMTGDLRIFEPNELGNTSIDNTADSGKVAINASRPHSPLVKNLRGRSLPYDEKVHGPESLFSTTALVMPGAESDELKRLNFISTQYDSVYPIPGYMPMPYHTSMEYEFPYMVDDEFAIMAEDDGKVLEVGEDGILVLYKTKGEVGYPIGRRFGRVAGIVIPHSVVTDLKPGQHFKKDDALAWNESFFQRSHIMKNRLDMKQAFIVPTVFQELPITFEDSASMWEGLSDKYAINYTKEIHHHVKFDEEVKGLVSIGDSVEEDDALFVRIPPHLQGVDHDDETIGAFKDLNIESAKANAEGVVENIEVFYYGNKDEMHPTLKALANASDRRRKRKSDKWKQQYEADNGMVTTAVNFAGRKIEPGSAVVKFYITKFGLPTVSGNKTVNGSNLKNTVTQYFKNEIEMIGSDEKGQAYFSYQGQNNRVVLSAIKQGLCNRALILGTQDGCKIYRGTK